MEAKHSSFYYTTGKEQTMENNFVIINKGMFTFSKLVSWLSSEHSLTPRHWFQLTEPLSC